MEEKFSGHYIQSENLSGFQDALKEQILSKESLCGDDIEEFQSFVYRKYDIIIADSDEIWRPDGIRGLPKPYFLPGDLGSMNRTDLKI